MRIFLLYIYVLKGFFKIVVRLNCFLVKEDDMCEMDVRVSSYCHLEGVGLLLQIRRIVLKIYL